MGKKFHVQTRQEVTHTSLPNLAYIDLDNCKHGYGLVNLLMRDGSLGTVDTGG